MKSIESNLEEEFNNIISNIENNNMKTEQLVIFANLNFVNDKIKLIDCFLKSFVTKSENISLILFKFLSEMISSTYFEERDSDDSYYQHFAELLYNEFHWLSKKFKSLEISSAITTIISKWSEKAWGPMKNEVIYLNDFTEHLIDILRDHCQNLKNQNYVNDLDNLVSNHYLIYRKIKFIKNGLDNPLVRESFNLRIRDKNLDHIFKIRATKDILYNYLNIPNFIDKGKYINKYRNDLMELRDLIAEQMVKRELFIKQLLKDKEIIKKKK